MDLSSIGRHQISGVNDVVRVLVAGNRSVLSLFGGSPDFCHLLIDPSL